MGTNFKASVSTFAGGQLAVTGSGLSSSKICCFKSMMSGELNDLMHIATLTLLHVHVHVNVYHVSIASV